MRNPILIGGDGFCTPMSLFSAEPVGIAALGLLLGMRHATDADHVVAVTAILSRERRLGAAARIGAVWGLGHTLTVMVVGAAIIIFKLAVPVRLGLAMEFAVALALIALGATAAANLMRSLARKFFGGAEKIEPHAHVHSHRHVHSHDESGGFFVHSHPHVHSAGHAAAEHEHLSLAGEPAQSGFFTSFAATRPLMRSFAVGLVHGLAGSAALALLVLSAIPQPLWAAAYLAVFCVGVIVGMALLTIAIATPFVFAARRFTRLHEALITGSGLLSFGFGLVLAYQIGIVDRLFGAAPLWIPH
jgi:hypothetical protein